MEDLKNVFNEVLKELVIKLIFYLGDIFLNFIKNRKKKVKLKTLDMKTTATDSIIKDSFKSETATGLLIKNNFK